MEKKGIAKLVTSLGRAIDEFKKSKLMREVFGEHSFNEYIAAKEAEWESYKLSVTEWEKDRYMEVY